MSPVDNIYCVNTDVSCQSGEEKYLKNVTSRVKNVPTNIFARRVTVGVTITIKNEYKKPVVRTPSTDSHVEVSTPEPSVLF
jgi:hypothetical protein